MLIDVNSYRSFPHSLSTSMYGDSFRCPFGKTNAGKTSGKCLTKDEEGKENMGKTRKARDMLGKHGKT